MISRILIVLLMAALILSLVGCVPEYEVTLKTEPRDAGEVLGSGAYQEGELASIAAEPYEGYIFAKWSEDGEKVSQEQVLEFEVKREREMTAVFKEEKTLQEKAEDAGLSLDEIKGFAKSVFAVFVPPSEKAAAVFGGRAAPDSFYGKAEKALKKGNLSIHYPGINEYIEKLEFNLEDLAIDESEIEIEVSLKYPHIKQGDFDEFGERIIDEIMERAGDGDVNLRNTFAEVLAEQTFSREAVMKKMVIIKEEDELLVADLDPPHKLFSSFDQLYRQAVAAPFDKVVATLGVDNVFERGKDTVSAVIMDQDIELISPGIDPHYMLEKTIIVLADNTEIQLKNIWEQLTQQQGYNPYLHFGPEDYFNRIEFREIAEYDKKAIYLTRPYAVATMDTVLGYLDLKKNVVNLFDNTMGAGQDVSVFYFSPEGNYLAYHYIQSGSGFANLSVYDQHEDKVINVSNFAEFKEEHGIKQGFIGIFKNLRWSQDESYLYFESEPTEQPNAEADPDQTIAWKYDAHNRKLQLHN